MSRDFVWGCEGGGQYFPVGVSHSGASIASSAGLGMDGSYCLQLDALGYCTIPLTTGVDERFAFLFRSDTNGYYGNLVLAFMNGSNICGQLILFGDGYLYAYRNGTVIATSSILLAEDTTYWINGRYYMDDSVGRFIVNIDGVNGIDFTGDTNPGQASFSTARIGSIPFRGYGSYYDNLIFDTNTDIPKTHIGKQAITGAGNSAQWTPSTGSNYQTVDEIPASETDYNSTNSASQKDTFAVETLSGINGTIYSVVNNILVVAEGAPTPTDIKGVTRSGGTDYASSAITAPASPEIAQIIEEVDPDTSSAWTLSGVNNSEPGYESA